MSKVITVFNQKGGVGKTSTTMQLGGTLARWGLRVAIFDMDPQQSAVAWKARAETDDWFPAQVYGMAPLGGKIFREIEAQRASYDVILVDCPPAADSPAAGGSMMVSDLALIPIVPAPLDMWAAVAAKKAAVEAMARNPDLKARVLVNNYQPATSMAGDVIAVLSTDEDVPLLTATLPRRVAYQECQTYGGTVHIVPRSEAAIRDVEALAAEVCELLGIDVPERLDGVAL